MKSRTGKKKKPSKNRLDVYAKKHGLTKPDTDADGFIKDKTKNEQAVASVEGRLFPRLIGKECSLQRYHHSSGSQPLVGK